MIRALLPGFLMLAVSAAMAVSHETETAIGFPGLSDPAATPASFTN